MIPLALPGRESWCAAPEHRVGPLLDRDPRASLGPWGTSGLLMVVLTVYLNYHYLKGWLLVVIFLSSFSVLHFLLYFDLHLYLNLLLHLVCLLHLHHLHLPPLLHFSSSLFICIPGFQSLKTSSLLPLPLSWKSHFSQVVPTDQLTIVCVQHLHLHGWGHLVSEIPAQKAELLKIAELKGSPLNHLRAAVALKD